MKKYFALVLVAGYLTSCGSDQTEETNETGENPVAEDTITVDSVITESLSFNTIEDYATIIDRADLYEKFDASALKDGESWYAEGTVKLEHTKLTNPENQHVVKFVWDEENPKKLGSIEFVHQIYNDEFEVIGTQKIESSTGLYTGMKLKDLVAWNGAPISFSGFGWDYAGGIMAKTGSKIFKSELSLRLDVDYDAIQEDKYDGLVGDMELSSDDAVTKDAGIFLGFITYWPKD
jgi:hypothetical protein